MSKVNKNPDRQNFSLLLLAIIFLVCNMAILPWINIDTQKKLLIEGGLFESSTVYGYFFCLILIFVSWPWQKILSKWYFSALIILFALRELDYDKAHFTHGVLKSKQYFSDLVGMHELLISIGVLIFILVILASIILREKNSFIKGIRDLKQSQLAVLASIILVIVTIIVVVIATIISIIIAIGIAVATAIVTIIAIAIAIIGVKLRLVQLLMTMVDQ
jgi:hypothetical protein